MEYVKREEVENRIKELPLFEIADAMYKIKGEGGIPTITKKFIAIKEVGKDIIHDFPSNKYVLVQFEKAFSNSLKGYESYEGNVFYYNGTAILIFFPDGDDYKITDEERIGIMVINSVNRSQAVGVSFVIKSGSRIFNITDKKTRFKESHIGSIHTKIENHTQLLEKLKDSWVTIVYDLNKYIVDNQEKLADICKAFDITEQIEKELGIAISAGDTISVWGIVKMQYDKIICNPHIKTDVSRLKYIGKLSKQISTWKFLSSIETK